LPGKDFGPKLGEAGGEVGALLGKQGEPFAVSLMVVGRHAGAVGFFRRVENFEREDGEPVDHKARGFGVERGRLRLRWRGFKQRDVDALDEVVAELVEGVDGVLDLNHGAVGGQRGAGLVFAMPEIEVGTVLFKHELIEASGGGAERLCSVVPVGGGLVVELGDDGGVQHEGAGSILLEPVDIAGAS